jgi:GTP-binding protein
LIHLLDGSAENPVADFHQINTELALFDERLGQKPQVIAVNKMDLPQTQERWPGIRDELKNLGYDPILISAATHDNVRPLLYRAIQVLDSLPEEPREEVELALYQLGENPLAFTISREDNGGFRVSGKRIERAVAMTYWDYDQAVNRFQRILESMGIVAALKAAGVRPGDTVYIGDMELEWDD